MATRSRIGIELKNGSILSCYHHWDGYPEWLGRILNTHYNTKFKVAELIDGGDMSCCWTDKDWNGNEWSDCKYKALTYAERGDDCPPRLDSNLQEYLDNGEEYAYIFNRLGEWICYDLHDEYATLTEIPAGALAV